MNMDPKKAMEDTKEKLKNRKPVAHLVDLEKGFRELKTELYIKRDEGKQLRTDLNAANLELQNLRTALNNAKNSSDEHQFNLNLILKKSRSSEEELQEKREALMKIQLQHKMAVAEVETLKEKLLKVETENTELSRKVDAFERKQRHNIVYYDEILEKENRLRRFVDEVNEMVVKLQAEHVQAIELSKKVELANDTKEKIKHFVEENEKLKKEKEHFEENFIKVNAKYEKLENLMSGNNDIQKPNLITEIIFHQWRINKSHNDTRIRKADDDLNKISEYLSSEKIANQELICKNEKMHGKNTKLKEENLMLKEICKKNGYAIEELSKKNRELDEKLKALDGNIKKDICMKQEPIEID